MIDRYCTGSVPAYRTGTRETLSIVSTGCEQCGHVRPVMVGMEGGFTLCRPCWSSGIAPMCIAEVSEDEHEATELPLEVTEARQVVRRGGSR